MHVEMPSNGIGLSLTVTCSEPVPTTVLAAPERNVVVQPRNVSLKVWLV